METREHAIERLQYEVTEGRADEAMQYLVEYLAEWGPDYVDVQALAETVLERQEG